MRQEAESERGRDPAMEIVIPPGPRLGDEVIVAEGLKKAFGEKLLFEDFDFRLPRGGIVGVIGPNGAGKTTLFRMLMGTEKPDEGTLKMGESVQLGYVDQSRDALDPENSIWQEISEEKEFLELGKRSVNSRAYVASFNFRGATQQKRVGDLSGGERNRVHLAKLLKSGCNVLLARRAHQRSRRRYAARAGRGDLGLRWLRGGDQPRSLVFRPHRHAHHGLRRR
jgi:sulfate-transporting ATPase